MLTGEQHLLLPKGLSKGALGGSPFTCHHYVVLECFLSPHDIIPRLPPPYPLAVTAYFLLPPALGNPNYFLSPDLSILDIPCKWNHLIGSILCLASFT